jgi:hypothetical protein
MNEKQTKNKIIIYVALFDAIAALGAMAFVLIEPIAAYDNLAAGVYGFEPAMRDALMASRMSEASIPLIIATLLSVPSIGMAVYFGAGEKIAKATMGIGGVALVSALYVWAAYGDGILSAM